MVVLVRNFLVAFVPLMAPTQPSVQLCLLSLLTLAGLIVVCRCYPWRSHVLNMLDIISFFCLCVIMISGQVYAKRTDDPIFFDVEEKFP